jgi:hypothetical protein
VIFETLRIDDLLLRVPGVDERDAPRLAREVGARLARALDRAEMSDVPAGATLHVRIPYGTPRGEMADVVARQILEALR